MQWFKRIYGNNRREELDRELRFHVDAETEANVRRGMPRKEAYRQARIAFGAGEQVHQQVREVESSRLLEAVRANGRAAWRFVGKSPSFSLVVVLTLALGIGANTAVFSAVHAVLLRPLAFPHGEQLTALYQLDLKNKATQGPVAPPRLEDWNRLNRTFTAIGGYYMEDISELSGSLPERLDEAVVTARFLEVWGVAPALGRGFTTEEQHFGGPSAVLISDRYWRRHFGAAPNAVGKRLQLGVATATVVGVMPASFPFPERDIDIWAPSPVDAPYAQSRQASWYFAVGRLRPAVTLAQARTDLQQVQAQLGHQFAATDRDVGVAVEPLQHFVVGEAGKPLWLLYGSVTLLLLIACGNIMALLLARTAQREHEISIRFSLGASRRAVLGQLMSETLVLALGGAALGLCVAAGALRLLRVLGSTLPRANEVALNWPILLYTLGCALVVTLLCGLLPAVQGTRRELARSLALGSRAQVASRGRLPWMLVGAQVALAVTLLVVAGLLLRSLRVLGSQAPGFDASHILTMQISGSYGETGDMARLIQRIDRTLAVLGSTPGVETAATASTLPGVPGQQPALFHLTDGPVDPSVAISAVGRIASVDYFHLLRIPLLEGELCRGSDAYSAVLVNRSFATAYLRGSDAVGRHLVASLGGLPVQPAPIRGIVADAREDGAQQRPRPTVYWCGSAPSPMPYFLLRTHGDPLAMEQTVRRAVRSLDPGRAVYGVSTLADHLDEQVSGDRLLTLLLTLFAGTAISLACVGLYGTLSYLGRQRRRELGLRLAIGASRSQVAWQLLRQGLGTAAGGCAAGVVFGWLSSHLLAGFLFGVTPADPSTYAGIVGLVALVAALASSAPALRAATINPVDVLRDE